MMCGCSCRCRRSCSCSCGRVAPRLGFGHEVFETAVGVRAGDARPRDGEGEGERAPVECNGYHGWRSRWPVDRLGWDGMG